MDKMFVVIRRTRIEQGRETCDNIVDLEGVFSSEDRAKEYILNQCEQIENKEYVYCFLDASLDNPKREPCYFMRSIVYGKRFPI